MIKDEGLLRYSDYHTGNGRAFYEAVAEVGLEGMVAKRVNSPYQTGRGGGWLKIKCPRVERFVIGGWTDPAGSRTHFGALLLGQYEAPGVLRFVGRVGTGFDDKRLAHDRREARERAIDASPFRRRARGRTRDSGRRAFLQSRNWYAKSDSANGPRTACCAIQASSG